jgi:hypothetical protein
MTNFYETHSKLREKDLQINAENNQLTKAAIEKNKLEFERIEKELVALVSNSHQVFTTKLFSSK